MNSRVAPLILSFTLLFSSAGCDAVINYYDDPLRDQESIQPHERPLSSVPAGVVPTNRRAGGVRVTAAIEPAQSPEEAKALRNPFRPTPGVIEAGKIGYDRYCSHCHGASGYGWTSVGSSLDPPPPDMVSAIAGRGDGEIFGAITFGTDKQHRVPISLGATIAVDDRWRIIHYVRTLPQERRGTTRQWDQQILRE